MSEFIKHRLAEERKIIIRKEVWEWDDFVYVEVWHNMVLKDNYFCLAGDIYPNGDVRPNARKFFYSKNSTDDIRRELKPVVKPSTFTHFDKLYYFDEDGEIFRIDGTPASECDYIEEAREVLRKRGIEPQF